MALPTDHDDINKQANNINDSAASPNISIQHL
jgi:hypothetical protein